MPSFLLRPEEEALRVCEGTAGFPMKGGESRTPGVSARELRSCGRARLMMPAGFFFLHLARQDVNNVNVQSVMLQWMLLVVLLPLVLFGPGCSTETATQDSSRSGRVQAVAPDRAPAQVQDDVLGVGDQLQITVLGYPEFNSMTSVNPSGVITVPVIGEVRAVGLSKDALQAEIVRRLSDFVKTKVYVSLNLTSVTAKSIILLGAVGTQNNYPRNSPVSVFQLLASAGGPAGDADLGHVRLYRNGDLTREEEIDLSGIMSSGAHLGKATPMVNPGDMVFVPRSESFLKEFSPFLYNVVVALTLFSFVK